MLSKKNKRLLLTSEFQELLKSMIKLGMLQRTPQKLIKMGIILQLCEEANIEIMMVPRTSKKIGKNWKKTRTSSY